MQMKHYVDELSLSKEVLCRRSKCKSNFSLKKTVKMSSSKVWVDKFAAPIDKDKSVNICLPFELR